MRFIQHQHAVPAWRSSSGQAGARVDEGASKQEAGGVGAARRACQLHRARRRGQGETRHSWSTGYGTGTATRRSPPPVTSQRPARAQQQPRPRPPTPRRARRAPGQLCILQALAQQRAVCRQAGRQGARQTNSVWGGVGWVGWGWGGGVGWGWGWGLGVGGWGGRRQAEPCWAGLGSEGHRLSLLPAPRMHPAPCTQHHHPQRECRCTTTLRSCRPSANCAETHAWPPKPTKR